MFQLLSRFDRILVSGPQRSGTTFAAYAIARELGLAFLKEEAFDVTNVERFRQVVKGRRGIVVQCPSMCRYLHYYAFIDGLAVVIMNRHIPDIIASQIRVKWKHEAEEKNRYRDTHFDTHFINSHPISTIKYVFWKEYQSKVFRDNWFMLPYWSLSTCEGWVEKGSRGNFKSRQISIQG